ncbi:MAG: DsbA family protein [Acidobacteriota bacterium]|nr:DsbA family protein [Acidobacteriota bacterium]
MRLSILPAAVVLCLSFSSSACAQGQDVETLRKEVDALKMQQAQMAEELRRVQQAMGVRPASLSIGNAPSRGQASAPLVLVEFSDYECPFCIRHFTQTMPELEREYIATGKLRYVFMDFPIDQLHPAALKAHEAARCGGEQGKYWEMHNRLFTPAGTHGVDQLKSLASDLGLDRGRFDTCLDSGRMQAPVRASIDTASGLGADGTPQMYLGIADANGTVRIIRSIRGAVPYEQIKQLLDGLLASRQ